VTGEALSELLPWLRWLPEAERASCVRELRADLVAGLDTGQLLPFARTLASWRATAEIWSDPQLACELQGPFAGDGPELGRPCTVAPMEPMVGELFDFIAYSARLREVERHNYGTPQRRESVAEHSWHLALIAWLLHGEFERETGQPLDLLRMMKMCLMHDLVEVDAGDPSAWREVDRQQKAEQEEAVAQRRFGALPGPLAGEFLELWHEYEQGSTPEARLVRGVDRLNPALMRLLTGQGWRDVPADAEALDRLQLPRVGVSGTLTAMYEHVRETARERGLFAPEG
jgi:putative hydrolase of HD superfamily